MQNFVGQMIRVASAMGFRIEQPFVRELRNDAAASYADMLENIKSSTNPMLIFCVATNNRMDRYSAIKKKCCVDRPVPTQVVLAKSLQNKNAMSIATKIVIQMNCKIGGIPWSIPIPLKGLMVVGFDVCHDTNTKDKDFGKYSIFNILSVKTFSNSVKFKCHVCRSYGGIARSSLWAIL